MQLCQYRQVAEAEKVLIPTTGLFPAADDEFGDLGVEFERVVLDSRGFGCARLANGIRCFALFYIRRRAVKMKMRN